jgi:hypothetical protein
MFANDVDPETSSGVTMGTALAVAVKNAKPKIKRSRSLKFDFRRICILRFFRVTPAITPSAPASISPFVQHHIRPEVWRFRMPLLCGGLTNKKLEAMRLQGQRAGVTGVFVQPIDIQ